jgi:Ca-activated chloride channel family protein
MTRTQADLRAGERVDIVVEFISRRTVDTGEGRVHRLVVADRTGERVALLVAPGREPPVGLETGASYRVAGLLGADPVETAPVAGDCPDCGGRLRPGSAADLAGSAVAAAAAELGLEAPFGVVDARTTVRPVLEAAPVDDWTPMDAGRETPPEFVCRDCGRQVEGRHSGTHGAPAEGGAVVNSCAPPSANMAAPSDETLGLSAGGATDVTNFRENVASGYTPQPEAIADEGLFADYYFETGDGEGAGTEALFAPRYATAVTEHPLDGGVERYLSVGLDSTLSAADFQRPRLDLVAVLDVSGSMDSPFDGYYYDEHGRRREAADRDGTTKLEAATRSLCALTEQLHEDDRLGVVLFNHRAHVAKPLRDVGATDMPAIRRHIREVAAGGGTNLADGFEAAVDMLADGSGDRRVERRAVFMTDMMPNTGATGEGSLTALFEDAAELGVHTTFVGMGLDANAALTDALSGIRGANHCFVHSAAEFERRLGEEFDYMVTPLVYDLTLDVETAGYEVAAVHGSPAADPASGRLLDVGTLFPSAKQDGKARGGVVLVRLERTAAAARELALVASWTERDGSEHTERVTVELPDQPGTFTHDGVRKAVALARYARELRAWAREVHERADSATGVDDWLLPDERGEHERESVPLVVPEDHAGRFDRLREHLAREAEAVGDERLAREVDLLGTLCEEAPARPTEVREG